MHYDGKHLKINLGNQPLIKPNDVIKIKPDYLVLINCDSALKNIDITPLAMPENPAVPHIEIQEPKTNNFIC